MQTMAKDAASKAGRVLPVLIYHASIGKTLTYGELGEITGDHYRSFKPAFAQVQRWIREFAAIRKVEPLPLAIIVVLGGGHLPGPGAIRWRLEANGLGPATSPDVIDLIFRDEQDKIFHYPDWHLLLKHLKLSPYIPAKTPIDEITADLVKRNRKGSGESDAHHRLKVFISRNPSAVDVPSDCQRVEVEFTFPSLDRADVLFEDDRTIYAIEVKSKEADDLELTRGMYQVVKYLCLSRALQLDRNRSPRAVACLAMQGLLSKELKLRSKLLGIRVFENIRVPTSFKVS